MKSSASFRLIVVSNTPLSLGFLMMYLVFAFSNNKLLGRLMSKKFGSFLSSIKSQNPFMYLTKSGSLDRGFIAVGFFFCSFLKDA